MIFPAEFYSKHHLTLTILTFFWSLPQSPHTAQRDRTVLVLPDHCTAAFLNYFSQQESALFPVLKAFFSPQLARNSPHSPAFQSTFNDTQGCGVPRLIQVHRGFFIIIPLFKLSAEKMKKREKILGFFPFPFSSMKKKKIILRTRKSSALIVSLQKKQSEIRNSWEGEETCAGLS